MDRMTDQQRLIALLESFGLKDAGPCRPCFVPSGQYVVSDEVPDEDLEDAAVGVTIGSGVGYCSFFCSFYFDENGKYVGHGCWE